MTLTTIKPDTDKRIRFNSDNIQGQSWLIELWVVRFEQDIAKYIGERTIAGNEVIFHGDVNEGMWVIRDVSTRDVISWAMWYTTDKKDC